MGSRGGDRKAHVGLGAGFTASGLVRLGICCPCWVFAFENMTHRLLSSSFFGISVWDSEYI